MPANTSRSAKYARLKRRENLRTLEVAAVQLGLHPNRPAGAADEAVMQVRDAARKGARLVCLPEHWLLSRVLRPDDATYRRFGDLARELDLYINMGANYEFRGDRIFVTSVTLSPDGRVLSRQDKLHLYRREKARAVPGTRSKLFDVDEFKVAVLVCHDLVFPETARTMTLRGAELLVVPALISTKGMEPWYVYLRARSLENRLPIVSPNIYAPPRFPGESRILILGYDKKEQVMEIVERRAPDKRTSIIARLDLRSLRPLREERLRELGTRSRKTRAA